MIPPPPHASHVTIVVMENRDYPAIVGNPRAPYFNQTLRRQGLLFTNAHAVAHPSEPNYLALFSGSTQGLTSDRCPVSFRGRSLASELADVGKRFTGYAEALPHEGFAGCWAPRYARKHVPWADFETVPSADNRPYRGLPQPMPDVAWIVPDMCHDMHDCSTAVGDDWLLQHVPGLIDWNAKHDGLLILTWDESDPDPDGTNRVPLLLVGPMVRPGTSAQLVTHYGILRTVEAMFGLPCIARDCAAAPIRGIWR
jgi:hypothetical protein